MPPRTTVAKTSSHKRSAGLKLYTEQPPQIHRSPIGAIASLPEVLRAFQRATGWSLQYVAGPEPKPSNDRSWSAPVAPGVGASPGHLRLDPLGSAPRATAASAVPRGEPQGRGSGTTDTPLARGREETGASSESSSRPSAAESNDAAAPVAPRSRSKGSHRLAAGPTRAMASALAGLLGELAETRQALWEREAELAAGVPLVPHPHESRHLAERLEAVLQGAAQALGCQAAALYLLDEATSKLKMRSCWGLPWDRLTAPARPLKGAVADLEAMLGHAVVLEDAEALRHWNVPEDFPAAACVPISTPTTILGTLWVFSDKKRDFNDRQTNILEIVSGRIASDLEREVLLREGLVAGEIKKQLAAAERLQRGQLPTISPLLDGWDVAGWTSQGGPLGGDFHDWFCLPDGLLAVAVGHAMDRGIEAALAAGALKAALRAHGQYYREAQQTLKRLNLTLWTGSAGDQRATLFYGLIETATGRVCCASAGQPGVIRVRPGGWDSLSHTSPQLGEGPESPYEQFGYELQSGEVLVVFTAGVRDAVDAEWRPLGDTGVAQAVLDHLDLSADDLAALVRRRLDMHTGSAGREDETVLVVKRSP